jgi:2-oxoisovalerate dehydrogenase E1 component alpha subunit
VDGEDLFAVHRTVREAVVRAARGEGPTIIEADTRPLVDRTREDALVRVRQFLEAKKLWGETEEREHVSRVRAELDVAIAAAEREPKPPRESLFDDVYAGLPWNLREEQVNIQHASHGSGRKT